MTGGDFYHDKHGNPLSVTGQHLTDSVSSGLYVAVIEKAQKERDEILHENETLKVKIKQLLQTILRLTERDQKEFDQDITRGVCSLLETETRAAIHRKTADALAEIGT